MKVFLLYLALLICPVFLGSPTDSQLEMMNNVIIHEEDIKDIGNGKPKVKQNWLCC